MIDEEEDKNKENMKMNNEEIKFGENWYIENW
jgi:hypothetical protein